MIIKFLAVKESKKIWRIYLTKNEFELAKFYCKENAANYNLVLTRQAEHLFANKKYNESARFYAQTQNSFEEICLKFLDLGDMIALRKFLTYKLHSLDSIKVSSRVKIISIKIVNFDLIVLCTILAVLLILSLFLDNS